MLAEPGSCCRGGSRGHADRGELPRCPESGLADPDPRRCGAGGAGRRGRGIPQQHRVGSHPGSTSAGAQPYRVCCSRPDCCSSPSRATPGSPHSVRRSVTRPPPFLAPSPWRWPSPWWSTPPWPSPPWPCSARHLGRRAIRPLTQAVTAAGVDWLAPVVRVGAAVAALGSLLALILGVSRTTLAMARDRHLPHQLAVDHPHFSVPHHAELAVGTRRRSPRRHRRPARSDRVLLIRGADLLHDRERVAWTLTQAEGRPRRWIPALGLLGCVGLAFFLPPPSIVGGIVVLTLGAVAYLLRRGRHYQH